METTKNLLAATLGRLTKKPQQATAPPLVGRLKSDWEKLLEPFQTLGDPDLERMATAATEFVTAVYGCARPHWLCLLGPSGSGKTMLAKIVMRFIRRHCLLFSPGYGITLTHESYSAKWPVMVAEMKHGDFGTQDLLIEQEDKWNRVRACTYKFALIDDIGQVEDAQKSYLMAALGRIADVRMGEWTVWTSNLGLDQIGELLDRRVASRMIRDGNVVVETQAPDWNTRQQ